MVIDNNNEILIVIFNLQGMGNDGGDIPKRKELVKQKPKVQIATAQSIAMSRARFCNLTNQPLKQPLAICRLGNIYNYELILQALVTKQLPAKYGYIRKLTDIKKIVIQRAPSYSPNFIACPISKLEYNGFNQFYANWECGHVVSKKALKEVLLNERDCVICQQKYEENDLIDLNLDAEHADYKRRGLLQKKKKKQQKKEGQDDEVKDQLKKKVKLQVHVNAMDRLGGQFRDVIRNREHFKGLFKKQEGQAWQNQTYNLTTTRTK